MSERGHYRQKREAEIAGIEARRRAGGFTVDELARKAGISDRSYRSMRRSGMAFKRTIKALQMALRTLEGEARREGEVFPL